MPLPPADYDAVGQTRSFVVGLADIAQQLEVLKRLKGLNEDVLGAYFFGARRPHVQIYWMSIGLFAATLDVSVEAMTVVVAAHELGHAYTHLGKDIDGRKWDTSSFAQADLHIVEGLAQFYTEVVCTKLADRLPEALVAFRRLRDLQSAPYKDYTTWVPDQPDAGEAVRAGMIQTRACGIRRYDIFRAAVSEQGKLLASARATA